ncbi:MAG: sulfotransferase family protein [Rhodobacteraceae bacterium]|nr:sulfotransferase family protein [Paracoccaceae bacterium]
MVVAVKKHQIAYMAVPKAACSSVKAALSTIDPSTSITLGDIEKDVDLIHEVYPTRRYRPHRWREYADWFQFTVVRDPLKRLLSVYTDRVVKRQELFNSPKLSKQFVLPQDPDPDFFFQHLDRYIASASSVKHHTLPFKLFLGPEASEFDRVFKIEELPELAEKLSDISGEKVSIPRFNRSKISLGLDDLKPETISFIRAYLEGDYALLSDLYDPPF